MLAGSEHHILSLTTRELSIAAVRGGRVVRTERVELDEGVVEDAWHNGLHELDQALRQILARLGVSSIRGATLLYMSPSLVTRVEVSPLEPGAASAKLGADIGRIVGRASPCATRVLGSAREGDEYRSVVLGYGDSDEHLRMLYAWLTRCRVGVTRMIPRQAVAVAKAYGMLDEAPEGCAVVYFAEHTSVIGYRDRGRDALMRVTEIGSGKIIDAFSEFGGVVDHTDEGAERVKITVDHARERAYEVGIPISGARSGGWSDELMPAIVPILQRYCVEIKQTFRFAANVEHSPTRLMVAGPACTIPSLAAALAQSLEYHIERDPDATGHAPCDAFGVGTLEHDSLRQIESLSGLLPRVAKEQRTTRTLMNSIRLGGVIAAIALGTEFGLDLIRSNEISAELEKQQVTIDQIERERNERLETARVARSIGAAATLVSEGVGVDAQWPGVLAQIPASFHDSVRVFEIHGRYSGRRPVLMISGHAVSSDENPDPSKLISEYIESLQSIEDVERIEIASTSRVRIDEDTDGVRFSLTLELTARSSRLSSLAGIRADVEEGGY